MFTAKSCTSCNVVKPITDFNKDSSRPDGFCIYCRECSKDRYKKYYHRDEKILNGIRKRRAQWSGKKKNNIREEKKDARNKSVQNLSDSYIRNILIHRSHIDKENITLEMIGERRQQILAYRAKHSDIDKNK